eukprot:CAMPEP_0198312354 /NCGR_PEP_ID=MMETSP1450-20131203/3742_1 /TAXON_ID=753684 ORGANISM="Madagascaria erythrocladiodes, Strain CCMP3234" /NCGR_SAMPLE_ID=MMETSP1450 /ASSEMBLY_ACC=CAM_ASM_001115 /LENGTH=346 /DNA_ID=CAMNT_0044015299 /DNA_START=46 /DNA_END=1086 /DNA_ORIENTATION=-
MTSLAFLTPSLPSVRGGRTSAARARSAPRASAAPAPELYSKFYPPASAFVAPKIVVGRDHLVIEMDKVPLADKGTDTVEDGPDPALYSAFGEDRLNLAPHITVTPGSLDDSPPPAKTLYGAYAGKPWFMKAPVISLASDGSGVSVSMQEAPLTLAFDKEVGEPRGWSPAGAVVSLEMKPVSAEVESDAPDPALYSKFFPESVLNKAPVIDISYDKIYSDQSVVKVSMAEIDGADDTEESELPPNPSLYKKFDNEVLNKAPFLSFQTGEDEDDFKIGVEMEEVVPSSLNSAPVIQMDGTDGIKVSSKTIIGDPSVIDRVSLVPAYSEKKATWSPEWRPASKVEKSWV